MKLHVLSDLHLDRAPYRPMDVHPLQVEADVVVIPGDITDGMRNVDWLQSAFADKPVVFVPGNHEYYGRNYVEHLETLRKAAAGTNIHLLSEDSVTIGDVRFLGSTLWTDFQYGGPGWEPIARMRAKTHHNDFKFIRYTKDEPFTPERFIELHERAVQWLRFMLRRPFEGKTVVVTHHGCSERSVAARWLNDVLTGTFVSNLDNLLGYSDLWIHGHTHHSVDYMAGDTRVVTNPRGHAISNFHKTRRMTEPVIESTENTHFDKDFVIEV